MTCALCVQNDVLIDPQGICFPMGIIVSKKELFGLLVVFIVYVLLGGLVFMLLERPLEERLRGEIEQLRTEFEDKLSRLGDPNVTREQMESLVLRLSTAHRMSLIDESGDNTHINWSFGNSFFFAITVVTTIGYGHLSPSTMEGRLFCVLYATIGIPLTGILLAAIGGHYSQRLVKGIQKAKKSQNSRLVLTYSCCKCLMPWLLVFLVLPAGIFAWLERWNFVDSFYYCFITLSTIGFGDFVAANFEGPYVAVYKTFVVLWIIFGLGYLAMILNYISRMMRCKQIRKVERKLSTSIYHTQQRVGQRLDEVYQLLQDVSKSRNIKTRRPVLKRMQSFPAPEVDRNCNVKIDKLIDLVQTLKEHEPVHRARRLSLPLPASTNLHPALGGRGSLQIFTSSTVGKLPSESIVRNGYQNKLRNDSGDSRNNLLNISHGDLLTQRESLNVDQNNSLNAFRKHSLNESQNNSLFQNDSFGNKNNSLNDLDGRSHYFSVPIIDVISAETGFINPKTVIDLEGLQCTRV